MIEAPLFPRPRDIKHEPVTVREPDGSGGRQILNLLTKEGRDIYMERKKSMWLRQGKRCCLYKFFPTLCRGSRREGLVPLDETVFEHQNGRTAGKRDDRIEKLGKDGKLVRINGASCVFCNNAKGSRRINYNEVL